MNNNLLSLLGLCKRAGMMEVGEEPVEAAARARDARVLLLARDAADNTARRVRHFSEEGACLWLRVPFTKEELGRAVGRTSCAVLAVTDIGFAANIVRRLAAEDPVRYDEAAARLELKARRAAERKAEMKAHEKNLRQGKVRKKPSRPAEAEVPPAAGRPRQRSGTPGAAGKRPAGQRRPLPSGGRTVRPGSRFQGSLPVKKGKGSPRRKTAAKQ